MESIEHLADLVTERRAAILEVAREHGAQRVRIFGSVARREDHAASDLDLLVDLEPGSDLFDIVAIKQGIETLLGRNVHVLTEGSLRPSTGERVLREAVPL